MIDREPGGVNLAGKVQNLFLVTIDAYRHKIEKWKSAGSRVVGEPMEG